jgi:hypothetical protein
MTPEQHIKEQVQKELAIYEQNTQKAKNFHRRFFIILVLLILIGQALMAVYSRTLPSSLLPLLFMGLYFTISNYIQARSNKLRLPITDKVKHRYESTD